MAGTQRVQCIDWVLPTGHLVPAKSNLLSASMFDFRAKVPNEVRKDLIWPAKEERADWLQRKNRTPIAIGPVKDQLGAHRGFYRVFEAIEFGEYGVLGCERVSPEEGEIRIDPHSSPYGGLGPSIALVEAYGFRVVGVKESRAISDPRGIEGTVACWA